MGLVGTGNDSGVSLGGNGKTSNQGAGEEEESVGELHCGL